MFQSTVIDYLISYQKLIYLCNLPVHHFCNRL